MTITYTILPVVFIPSSALQLGLHNAAMRRSLRLEYERKSCAFWAYYFQASPLTESALAVFIGRSHAGALARSDGDDGYPATTHQEKCRQPREQSCP